MSPRPNPGRTIGAEDTMRANVLRLLAEQERTAAWLARKADVSPTALHKSLHHDRRILVDEAIAIADALGTTVGELVR